MSPSRSPSYDSGDIRMPLIAKIGIGAGILVVAIIAFMIFGPFYSVDQGEEAVVLRNGAVVDSSLAGLHFKWPIIDAVKTISLQKQTLVYGQDQNYPMEAFSSSSRSMSSVRSTSTCHRAKPRPSIRNTAPSTA